MWASGLCLGSQSSFRSVSQLTPSFTMIISAAMHPGCYNIARPTAPNRHRNLPTRCGCQPPSPTNIWASFLPFRGSCSSGWIPRAVSSQCVPYHDFGKSTPAENVPQGDGRLLGSQECSLARADGPMDFRRFGKASRDGWVVKMPVASPGSWPWPPCRAAQKKPN